MMPWKLKLKLFGILTVITAVVLFVAVVVQAVQGNI